jgi:hypothetical protein
MSTTDARIDTVWSATVSLKNGKTGWFLVWNSIFEFVQTDLISYLVGLTGYPAEFTSKPTDFQLDDNCSDRNFKIEKSKPTSLTDFLVSFNRSWGKVGEMKNRYKNIEKSGMTFAKYL